MIWLAVAALAVLVSLWFGAPFVPTRTRDIRALQEELPAGKGRTFVDLGAGDGRIVAMAAERDFQAIGYEINPILWLLGRWRVRKLKNAQMVFGDWRKQDLSTVSILFVFSTSFHFTSVVFEQLAAMNTVIIVYGGHSGLPIATRNVGAFAMYGDLSKL